MDNEKCFRAVIDIHTDFDPNPIFIDFYCNPTENLIEKVDDEFKNTNNIPVLVRNAPYDLISLKQVEMCWGCRNDQPNQEAHQDEPYGCLRKNSPDIVLTQDLIDIAEKETKRQKSNSSSSLNLFNSN